MEESGVKIIHLMFSAVQTCVFNETSMFPEMETYIKKERNEYMIMYANPISRHLKIKEAGNKIN